MYCVSWSGTPEILGWVGWINFSLTVPVKQRGRSNRSNPFKWEPLPSDAETASYALMVICHSNDGRLQAWWCRVGSLEPGSHGHEKRLCHLPPCDRRYISNWPKQGSVPNHPGSEVPGLPQVTLRSLQIGCSPILVDSKVYWKWEDWKREGRGEGCCCASLREDGGWGGGEKWLFSGLTWIKRNRIV